MKSPKTQKGPKHQAVQPLDDFFKSVQVLITIRIHLAKEFFEAQ